MGWVRNPFSYFLLAVIAVLTLVGFRSQRRNGVAAIECVLVPYLILMVLWPFGAGIRYALPFVPWITFLALSGLHELSCRFKLRYPAAAPCGFLLLLAIPATQAYRASDFGTIRENTALPEFNQLCQTVRNTTLSAIYDESRDVAATDRVLPACNDAEADQEQGGVDPLCQRYDIETRETFMPPTSLRQMPSMKMVGSLFDM